MRLIAAASVLAALSCSPAPELVCTPGESRACTCTTGAMGAQVCDAEGTGLGPCECAPALDGGEADAGLEIDAGQDGGMPTALDAGMDGGRDGGVDAGSDAGPEWECSVVPQSGCRAGEACRLSRVVIDCSTDEDPMCTMSRSPGNGPPLCMPSGASEDNRSCTRTIVGGDCQPGRTPDEMLCEVIDTCQAGLFCWNGACQRYCDPRLPDPCPPIQGTPRRCVTDYLIDPNPLGLGVCRLW